MTASMHNFILTSNELNLIQGLLGEPAQHMSCDGTKERDEWLGNTIKERTELRKKIAKQRDEGYPAKNYPYWRKYFEDEEDKPNGFLREESTVVYPDPNWYPGRKKKKLKTDISDVLITEEQVLNWSDLSENSHEWLVGVVASVASGTYTPEDLQKDILSDG